MSENDRVHEASPIRLLKAKEDGLVARSGDLSRSLIWCVVLGSCFIFAGSFQSLFAEHLHGALRGVKVSWSNEILSAQQIGELAIPLLMFLVTIALLSLAAWHLQSPLSFKFDKAAPDFSRISPLNFWNRLLSANHWLKIISMFFGAILVLVLLLAFVWNQSFSLATMASLDLSMGLEKASKFLRAMLLAAGALILVLGVADYVRERIRLAMQLRMTDQERRDEARNSEMNPELRRRLIR